ncbi:hypothetical protein N7492_009727 [Penicillium capsulatum]|uniref:Myb-like domain-containing protein n=1 Tax=Penicillium capsulatum TaxID=69766 RepID=A0A9W9HN04_9EURO|nr:hypothetical protein N7492_009727 [Penicillium capsulatum]KAJ6114191.1 hypothetical protein N7512_007636 [Penicillium capsulatum]
MGAHGSIARHFSMPLLSARLTGRVKGLFSTPSPRIAEKFQVDGVSCPFPGWLDLIREGIPKEQFEVCDGDVYRYHTADITIEMPRSDFDILSSGVPLKLLQAPPDPEDIQAEREAREQMIPDLVRLQKVALEYDEKAQDTLLVLRGQNEISQEVRDPPTPSLDNPTDCLNGPTNSPTCTEVDAEKGGGQSEQVHDTLVQAGRTPKQAPSWWSPTEKRQLRDFLATRQHLSWSRIAQEYEERYHKGRSPASIAGQAYHMRISPRNKSRKTRGKLGRGEHLVLKIPSLPGEKAPSGLQGLSDGPLRSPSGSALDEPTRRENSAQQPQVQEEADVSLEYDLSSRDAFQGHSFANVVEKVQNGISDAPGALFNRILN